MKKAHVPTHPAPQAAAAPASAQPDRLYAMMDRVEAAARNAEADEAAAKKRAEERWALFRAKVDNEGFREGFLDEELAGTSFPFNLGGGEEELTIYIKQAVFARQERLDMVVESSFPDCRLLVASV